MRENTINQQRVITEPVGVLRKHHFYKSKPKNAAAASEKGSTNLNRQNVWKSEEEILVVETLSLSLSQSVSIKYIFQISLFHGCHTLLAHQSSSFHQNLYNIHVIVAQLYTHPVMSFTFSFPVFKSKNHIFTQTSHHQNRSI